MTASFRVKVSNSRTYPRPNSDSEIILRKIFPEGVPPQLQSTRNTLAKEDHPEIFHDDLLHWGIQLEKQNHFEWANQIYQYFIAEHPHKQWAQVAQDRLAAISGSGKLAKRIEFQSQDFLRNATDYKLIIPMMLGSGVFRLGKNAIGKQLVQHSGKSWWGQTWVTESLATSGAFLGESLAFSLSARGLQTLSENGVFWNTEGFWQDWSRTSLTLALLKGSGWIGSRTTQQLLKSKPISSQLAGRDLTLIGATRHVSGYLGLVGAHGLEAKLGIATDSSGLWLDSFSAYVALTMGAHLGSSLIGKTHLGGGETIQDAKSFAWGKINLPNSPYMHIDGKINSWSQQRYGRWQVQEISQDNNGQTLHLERFSTGEISSWPGQIKFVIKELVSPFRIGQEVSWIPNVSGASGKRTPITTKPAQATINPGVEGAQVFQPGKFREINGRGDFWMTYALNSQAFSEIPGVKVLHELFHAKSMDPEGWINPRIKITTRGPNPHGSGESQFQFIIPFEFGRRLGLFYRPYNQTTWKLIGSSKLQVVLLPHQLSPFHSTEGTKDLEVKSATKLGQETLLRDENNQFFELFSVPMKKSGRMVIPTTWVENIQWRDFSLMGVKLKLPIEANRKIILTLTVRQNTSIQEIPFATNSRRLSALGIGLLPYGQVSHTAQQWLSLRPLEVLQEEYESHLQGLAKNYQPGDQALASEIGTRAKALKKWSRFNDRDFSPVKAIILELQRRSKRQTTSQSPHAVGLLGLTQDQQPVSLVPIHSTSASQSLPHWKIDHISEASLILRMIHGPETLRFTKVSLRPNDTLGLKVGQRLLMITDVTSRTSPAHENPDQLYSDTGQSLALRQWKRGAVLTGEEFLFHNFIQDWNNSFRVVFQRRHQENNSVVAEQHIVHVSQEHARKLGLTSWPQGQFYVIPTVKELDSAYLSNYETYQFGSETLASLRRLSRHDAELWLHPHLRHLDIGRDAANLGARVFNGDPYIGASHFRIERSGEGHLTIRNLQLFRLPLVESTGDRHYLNMGEIGFILPGMRLELGRFTLKIDTSEP